MIPNMNCEFKSSMGNTKCILMKNTHLDLVSGVMMGYVKITENIGKVFDMLRAIDSYDEQSMINIDDIPTTYATTNKRSGITLDICDLKLYNIVLNRFRDSNTIFKFIARASINDVEKFKTILEQGGNHGENNIRRIEK